MTETGTFIINGTERVIVSQLHRSPGRVVHPGDPDVAARQGRAVPRLLDRVRVRQEAGALRSNRPEAALPRHRVLAGARPREQRSSSSRCSITWSRPRSARSKVTLHLDQRHARHGGGAGDGTGRPPHRELRSCSPACASTRSCAKQLARRAGPTSTVAHDALVDAILAQDLIDPSTGEVVAEANAQVSPELLARPTSLVRAELKLAFPGWDLVGEILTKTIEKDPIRSKLDAIMEVYRRLRPGDPPTEDSAHDAVRRSVLRRAQVRPFRGRALQVQRQAGPAEGPEPAGHGPGGLHRGGALPAEAVPRASDGWTTSTHWPTAGSAPSASCSRTSSASDSSGWSARSRSA